MAGFFLPDARMQMPELLEGRKPIGTVKIDWEHPLSKGLLCAIVPDGSNFGVDLADAERTYVAVGTTNASVSETGWAYKKPLKTDNSYLLLSKPVSLPMVVDGFTEAFTFKPLSDSAYAYDMIGNLGTSARRYGLNASAGGYLSTMLAYNGSWGFSHGYIPTVGEWFTSILYTREGKRVWDVNDIVVTDQITSSTPKYLAPSFDVIFEANSRARSTPGELGYMFAWERSLSDNERRAFKANPYQFLIPAGT